MESSKRCNFCGRMFSPKYYKSGAQIEARWAQRKYCSRSCANSKHELTRDGYRARARKFLESCCESCGVEAKLSIHHKNRDWSDNHRSNLMTLCASCHTSLHHAQGDIVRQQKSPPCVVCGKPSKGHRLCQKHLQRKRKYGDPDLTKINVGGCFVLVKKP